MSPTPIEGLEARRWDIALGVSRLLEAPREWRHRRTERFELRSADEVRRYVGVDFTVPAEVWGDLLLRPAPAGTSSGGDGDDDEDVIEVEIIEDEDVDERPALEAKQVETDAIEPEVIEPDVVEVEVEEVEAEEVEAEEVDGSDGAGHAAVPGAAAPTGAAGSLPEDPHSTAVRTGRDGEWIVPLGWLRRGPLVGFDLRQDGVALPLLLASEIEVITRTLLEFELLVAVEPTPAPDSSSLVARAKALIERCVVLNPAAETEADVDRFATDYGELVAPLVDLMRAALAGFLLLVLVPRVDRRQIVKVAYDGPVPRDKSHATLAFDTPGILEASTSHLESPLPVELRAASWVVRERASGKHLSEELIESDHPSLYVRADEVERKIDCIDEVDVGEAEIGVLAKHEIPAWRFHLPAVVLALSALAVVAYGGWVADLDSAVKQGRGGSIATLLLAGFALFVALLLRLDEHSLARRILRAPRLLLAGVLVVALVAAAALAFAGKDTTTIWRVASIVLLVLTLCLVWTARSLLGGQVKRAWKRLTG